MRFKRVGLEVGSPVFFENLCVRKDCLRLDLWYELVELELLDIEEALGYLQGSGIRGNCIAGGRIFRFANTLACWFGSRMSTESDASGNRLLSGGSAAIEALRRNLTFASASVGP